MDYLWIEEKAVALQFRGAVQAKNIPLQAKHLQALAEIYVLRFQRKSHLTYLTKAAALCNAAIVRTSDEQFQKDLEQTLHQIEVLMVKHTLGEDFHETNLFKNIIGKNKSLLKSTRELAKERCSRIMSKSWSIDLEREEEENERLQREKKFVRQTSILFRGIAKRTKQFISSLLKQCFQTLGHPPCKYAVLALGSLAREEATPYSDFEFLILLENSSTENVVYFRNLTHYLHLKVINLGETPLPSMAIKSLNDFSEDGEDWFYDDITPCGFKFDGSMPWASKVPTGRAATLRRPAVELIGTPNELIEYQNFHVSVRQGYHLADIVTTVSPVEGDMDLYDRYLRLLQNKLDMHTFSTNSDNQEINKYLQIISRINQTLSANTSRHIVWNSGKNKLIQFKMFHFAESIEHDNIFHNWFSIKKISAIQSVKNDIYRQPTIILQILRFLYVTHVSSSWQFIESFFKDNIKQHNISVMFCIALMMRLNIYLHTNAQKENFSFHKTFQNQEVLRQFQVLECSALILRFYQTAWPFFSCIFQDKFGISVCPQTLYDNSSLLRCVLLMKFNSKYTTYEKEKNATLRNLSSYDEIMRSTYGLDLCGYLASQLAIADHVESAVDLYSHMLSAVDSSHQWCVSILCHIAELHAHQRIYNISKALAYTDRALDIVQNRKCDELSSKDIFEDMSHILNVRGQLYFVRERFPEACCCFQQAYDNGKKRLESMKELLRGHPYWNRNVEKKFINRKAEKQFMNLPTVKEEVYCADSHMFHVCLNFAKTLIFVEDFDEALSKATESLQIANKMYGEGTATYDTFLALRVIGLVYFLKREVIQALYYFQQALYIADRIKDSPNKARTSEIYEFMFSCYVTLLIRAMKRNQVSNDYL